MSDAFSFHMFWRILDNEFPAAAYREEIENVNLQTISLKTH